MTATPATSTIRDLIARDLDQHIEGIVKVNQDDDDTVLTEITEYVPTAHIRAEYLELFDAVAKGPRDATEGVGIWVSGFFGSGKSSFAKNLGYALRNPEIRGKRAAQLLAAQLDDPAITRLIDYVTHNLRTTVVMFDVTSERSLRDNRERIAEIVYNVTLRELGYPEDWTLADLEMSLEDDGTLTEFLDAMAEAYPDATGRDAAANWAKIAKSPSGLNKASAILHRTDPVTFPTADSWAAAARGREPRLDVADIARRIFDLMGRRRPGEGLVYVIDEVGQYVGRSGEKIEDLRALVEQLGKESANRVRTKQFPAPVWLLVTSQEKLDEVVSALDGADTLLPKLRDRFRHQVDLVPTDIREVATKRVLGKTPEGDRLLRQVFAENEGRLRSFVEFERSSRKTDLTAAEFAQFYPYLPHFIDLSIDIVSGLRAKSTSFKQTGAANRTLIKQAFEMLTGEPALAAAPVGTLVTIDKVYDLVRHSGVFDNAHRIEMDRVRQEFGDGSWEERVAKALVLLEFVRNLPRTPHNVAATLYDRLGADSPGPHVQAALANLAIGSYARETEEGWKLQTAEEKSWDAVRRATDPRPKERNEVVREAIGRALADVRTHKLENRTFKVGLTVQVGRTGVETKQGDDGPIALRVRVVEDDGDLGAAKAEAQEESRAPRELPRPIWVAVLTPQVDDLARELLRSRAMVNKHEQLQAQRKLAPELVGLLAQEKQGESRLAVLLADRVATTLHAGTGYHAGNASDGGDLGNSLTETVRGFLARAAPRVFPNLVSAPLTGKEPERLLTDANLTNLPGVLYEENGGLGFVVKREGQFVVDVAARPLEQVLGYLKAQAEYGETRNGRNLQDHFADTPYGWDNETVRLALAALLRAGRITVTYNGRPYRSWQDPGVRPAFTNLTAFRSSTFAPKSDDDFLTLEEIGRAIDAFRELTGDELEYDQEAIAKRFREFAVRGLQESQPVYAKRAGSGLPDDEDAEAYLSLLESVGTMDGEDAVRSLSTAGHSLRSGREAIRRIQQVVDGAFDRVRLAQVASRDLWPLLRRAGFADAVLANRAQELAGWLADSSLYSNQYAVMDAGEEIARAYATAYEASHRARAARYAEAIEAVKSAPGWERLQPSEEAERQAQEANRHAVLGPLEAKACDRLDLSPGEVACRACFASLGQLVADVEAVGQAEATARERLRVILEPTKTRRTVRARSVLQSVEIADEAGAQAAVDLLLAAILAELGADEDTVVVVE